MIRVTPYIAGIMVTGAGLLLLNHISNYSDTRLQNYNPSIPVLQQDPELNSWVPARREKDVEKILARPIIASDRRPVRSSTESASSSVHHDVRLAGIVTHSDGIREVFFSTSTRRIRLKTGDLIGICLLTAIEASQVTLTTPRTKYTAQLSFAGLSQYLEEAEGDPTRQVITPSNQRPSLSEACFPE